jgi:hypothetical protein
MMACTPQAISDDTDAKNLFDKEYPKALARLRERLSHVQGSGTETVEQASRSGKPVVSVSRFIFLCDGDKVKLEVDKDSGSRKASGPAFSTRAVNDDYVFLARRRTNTSAWTLYRIEPRGTGRLDSQLSMFRNTYIYAPFCALKPLDELFWQPGTTIRRVAELKSKAGTFIEVECDRQLRFGRNWRTVQFRITLTPDNGWVVNEYEMKIGPEGRHGITRVQIEYGPSIDGVPMPSRIVKTQGKSARTVFEFDELKFAHPQSNDFKLAAVGLPEVMSPRRGYFTNWYWLIAVATALAAIAFLVRRWPTRRPKATDQT